MRNARTADLAGIEEVQAAAGLPFHADSLRAATEDPQRLVVIAVAGPASDVVGWAKTHHYLLAEGLAPAGHYLGGVTVDPAWRRRGVGTALTAARMEWIAAQAGRVHCVVAADNNASIALHERWGFREVTRAAELHDVTFAGGVGLLLSADLTR